jgi:hypothetical protein
MKFLMRLSLALTVACVYAVATAILMLAAPKWQLERLLLDLKIGEMIPFFAPPLSAGALSLLVLVTAGMIGVGLYLALSRMFPTKPPAGLKLPQMPSSGLLDRLPPQAPRRMLPPRQIRPAPIQREARRDAPHPPNAAPNSKPSGLKRRADPKAPDALMLHFGSTPGQPSE